MLPGCVSRRRERRQLYSTQKYITQTNHTHPNHQTQLQTPQAGVSTFSLQRDFIASVVVPFCSSSSSPSPSSSALANPSCSFLPPPPLASHYSSWSKSPSNVCWRAWQSTDPQRSRAVGFAGSSHRVTSSVGLTTSMIQPLLEVATSWCWTVAPSRAMIGMKPAGGGGFRGLHFVHAAEERGGAAGQGGEREGVERRKGPSQELGVWFTPLFRPIFQRACVLDRRLTPPHTRMGCRGVRSRIP